MTRLDGFIDRLGDRVNPVLVKEVRQSFHNTWIVVFAAAVLIAELTIMFFLSSDVFSRTGRGSLFFAWLLCILMGGGVVIAGAIPMQRFYSERKHTDLDYSSITNLSAVRQVSGRLVSAMLTVGLLYAMCLPFMVISYFLGGVSLTGMLALALFFFLLLLLVAQTGLLFGSSGNRFASVLFLLGLLGSAWGLIILPFLLSGADEMATVLTLQNFWIAVSTTLLAWGMLFALTVSSVMPPAANRMLPVRSYAAGLILLAPLLPYVWGLAAADMKDWLYGCALFNLFLLFLISGIAACERTVQSARVLKHSPSLLILRVPYFLLSSGSGGGLLASWLIFGVIAVIFLAAPPDSGQEGYVSNVAFWAVKALFIAGLALFIRRKWNFFRKLPSAVSYFTMAGLVLFLEVIVMIVSGEWNLSKTFFVVCLVAAVATLLLNGGSILDQYREYALAARRRREPEKVPAE